MSFKSLTILIVGLIINIKIYYWIEISKKGFKSETPEEFLRRPNLYAIIDIVFFIIVLLFSKIPWYLVIVFYFLSFIPARMLAQKKFDEIVKMLNAKEK